ncbi:MAG: RAMP superfamily CRISPR-associated protein, partial [Cyanobacteria bacterium P01_C01_bin.72]
MTDSDRVPLMFRAQIKSRGKIQYAGNPEHAEEWVAQWLTGCPLPEQKVKSDRPVALRRGVQTTEVSLPGFGRKAQTKEYEISWRFVTNSGQDESIIRPVIGSKGMPFYPGSSMKGAFRRACSEEQKLKYCGGEIEVVEDGKKEPRTKPAELVFHGGYPVDTAWADKTRLVDVVHEQSARQVKDSNAGSSANIQISLYKPKYKFGISSKRELKAKDWQEIWQIWEVALSQGIGSRVSAGYGQVTKFKQLSKIENELFSVHLYADGIYSQLLNTEKTPEFRPNMFKAALRGHTLRLLAGVTNAATAEEMTEILWGSFNHIGKLGIRFTCDRSDLTTRERYGSLSTYNLEEGVLSLVAIGKHDPKQLEQLKSLAKKIVQFTLLLGGFGKSWRRVDHSGFYPEYLRQRGKLPIGCYWEIINPSEKFYVTANRQDLSNISQFLQNTCAEITRWVASNGGSTGDRVQN